MNYTITNRHKVWVLKTLINIQVAMIEIKDWCFTHFNTIFDSEVLRIIGIKLTTRAIIPDYLIIFIGAVDNTIVSIVLIGFQLY